MKRRQRPPEQLSWVRVPDEAELPEEVRSLFARAREKLGFVPNVLRVWSLRPVHMLLWRRYMDELIKGDSGLTEAQREMIGAVVSATNRCHYCITSHGAAVRVLTGDPILGDQLVSNYRHAAISAKERAMLDYAVKITEESHRCSEEDIDALRKAGWSDEDVMDIAEVAAMFNLTNRLASALGWLPNEEYHRAGR
ncbi:MAG: peroxidase-related enzyme [Gaiellales bacterium]